MIQPLASQRACAWRWSRWFIYLVLISAASTSFTSRASAQTTLRREVLKEQRGLAGSPPGFVGQLDASTTLLNPAELTRLRGWNVVFEASKATISPAIYRWGSGFAFHLARPLDLWGWRRAGLGLTVSRVGYSSQTLQADEINEDGSSANDTTLLNRTTPFFRSSFGLALDVVPSRLSIGANVGLLMAAPIGGVDSNELVDPKLMVGFGLAWRIVPWLAYGLSVDGIRRLQLSQNSFIASLAPEVRSGFLLRHRVTSEVTLSGQLGLRIDLYRQSAKDFASMFEKKGSFNRKPHEWIQPMARLRVDTPFLGGLAWWLGVELTSYSSPKATHESIHPIDTVALPVLSAGLEVPLTRRIRAQPAFYVAPTREKSEEGKDYVAFSPGMGLRLMFEEEPSSEQSRTVEWAYHIKLEDLSNGPKRRHFLRALEGVLVRQAAAIVLHAGKHSTSLADLEELRRAMMKWRGRKEQVLGRRSKGPAFVVYLQGLTLESLYLASAADVVLLHPAQPLDLQGEVTTQLYFGGALRRLGIDPKIVHSGEQGAMVERWMGESPTPDYVEFFSRLQNDRWNAMIHEIARARGIPQQRLIGWVEEAPREPSRALALQIVDGLVWPEELDAHLSEGRENPLHAIHDNIFLPALSEAQDDAPGLAVIHASGELIDGTRSRSLAQLARGVTSVPVLVELLQRLAHTRRTKAVILRLDSPGGTAWAARTLGRAIEELARRKPVVVSIGAQATGAAYYAALSASAIVADAGSVVGGVGAFRMGLSIRDWLEKVGISVAVFGDQQAWQSQSWCHEQAQVNTNELSLVASFHREFAQRVIDRRSRAVANTWRGSTDPGASIVLGSRAAVLGFVDAIGGLSQAREWALYLAKERFFASERDFGLEPALPPWAKLATTWLASSVRSQDLARLGEIAEVLKRLPTALAICGEGTPAVYSLYERFFPQEP